MFPLESNLPGDPRSNHKHRTGKVSFIEMNEVNHGTEERRECQNVAFSQCIESTQQS